MRSVGRRILLPRAMSGEALAPAAAALQEQAPNVVSVYYLETWWVSLCFF